MSWILSTNGLCAVNMSEVEALKIFYDDSEKTWFLMAYTGTGAVHTIGSYDAREDAVKAMDSIISVSNEAKA